MKVECAWEVYTRGGGDERFGHVQGDGDRGFSLSADRQGRANVKREFAAVAERGALLVGILVEVEICTYFVSSIVISGWIYCL